MDENQGGQGDARGYGDGAPGRHRIRSYAPYKPLCDLSKRRRVQETEAQTISAGKQFCDCGCGVEEHYARLKLFEIPIAIDESLRRTAVGRRFLVRQQCLEPFIEELQAMKLLNDMTRRYQGATWWLRVWRARQVLRLQFLINIRLKGIEETKKISTRSAVMFALPFPPTSKLAFIVSRRLYRYWQWADTHPTTWRWK